MLPISVCNTTMYYLIRKVIGWPDRRRIIDAIACHNSMHSHTKICIKCRCLALRFRNAFSLMRKRILRRYQSISLVSNLLWNLLSVSKSNSHDVTLVNVSRELTGTYKCEVSAGSPSYHTGIERAKMEVVAVPRDTLETLALVVSTKHDRVVVQVFPVCSVTPPAPLACRQVSNAPKTGPAIRTEKERIAVGEMLRANCTSDKSRPAPDVTWKLNGETIPKDSGLYGKIRHFQTSHDNVTQSITSLVEFRVTNSMFRKGYLHLRCTVFISDVYRKSADIEISEDTPRIASITGESPPFGHRKKKSVVAGKFNPYRSTLSSPRRRFVYERPDGSFGKSSGSR
ncbi:hypothetical protein ALC57_16572 [Trachymyrmex cornetzi]|uniref:Ig-like domain-containing protein n=1 Tax=Trachymyrmex cornetzi TaxID=471704 RepID=A0A151IUZ7_9HYME|nr:hypothetical protein ALC57_16572 [Trachymyrmex cornetzi]